MFYKNIVGSAKDKVTNPLTFNLLKYKDLLSGLILMSSNCSYCSYSYISNTVH